MGRSAHEIKLSKLSMEIRFFIDIEESSKAMIGKFESPRCGGSGSESGCGFETFCLNVSQLVPVGTF